MASLRVDRKENEGVEKESDVRIRGMRKLKGKGNGKRIRIRNRNGKGKRSKGIANALMLKGIWRKGISPVVSTIIITAILLIILVVATFVSTNILEMQVTSTEFEQAKSNMLALNQVIQDVALRPGSGSYLQFNQRSGGIGVYESANVIKISTAEVNIENDKYTLKPTENGTYQEWDVYGSSTSYGGTSDNNDNTGVQTNGTYGVNKNETLKLSVVSPPENSRVESITAYFRAKALGSLQAFYPNNYTLWNSTQYSSGNNDSLKANDSNYMIFKSYIINSSTNVVKNGNITEGLSNWTWNTNLTNNINCSFTSETYISADKSLYVKITDDSKGKGFNGYGQFNQTINIEGTPVLAYLNFSYKIIFYGTEGKNQTANIIVNITFPNGTTKNLYNVNYLRNDTTIPWQNVSLPIPITSGGQYNLILRAEFSTTKSEEPTITVYFDDIALEVTRSFGICEVEFIGLADLGNWKNLTWTVDSAWNTSGVNTTIQLYKNSLGYPTSGDGYYFYNDGIANSDKTVTQTITNNIDGFINGSGVWKIKIKGVKEVNQPNQIFELKVDLLKIELFYEGEVKAVLICRTNNSDYTTSDFSISHVNFENYNYTWNTNPSTNDKWTWEEVNALETGARATLLGQHETLQISEFWVEVTYSFGKNDVIYDSGKLYELVYRGGSRTAASGMVLAGKNSSVVSMSDQLGYVRVDANDGVRIILDFNRVRVVTNSIVLIGNTRYNFTEISVIRLEPGPLGGAGTINLKVQNLGTNVTTRVYNCSYTVLYIETGSGNQPLQIELRSDPDFKTAIVLIETVIRVSMG